MRPQGISKTIDLGDGYKYVQLDGRNWAISDRDSLMVVDPDVTRCKVIGPLIVGERKNADIDEALSKKYGFFIFDKRNKELIEGLDGRAFDSALLARSLPEKPF